MVKIMRQHQEAIAWSVEDLKGISPSVCKHKILMEENANTSIDHQRRLNPVMKEVVKKEVLKWLHAGFIYSISDSPWVSPVHVVQKNGGMTLIKNEKNELVPTRTITGWRVCIDYMKLNTTTRKNHYPLPFIDQISKTSILLLSEWLFWLQPDSHITRGSREDHIYMSLWNLCF